jgi:hypothetical protein
MFRLRARCSGPQRLGYRHCEERKRRSNPDAPKKLDCFANARNDVLPDTRSPSRSANDARGFARKSAPPHQRAQGMPGADAPAASRAKLKSTRVSHHRFTGSHRHSLRNGFNGLLRALPGEPGFVVTIPARLPKHRRELTPASGRQDHTASPSAHLRARHATGSASTAPCPAFVAIASRPSWWDRMAQVRKGDLPVGARQFFGRVTTRLPAKSANRSSENTRSRTYCASGNSVRGDKAFR